MQTRAEAVWRAWVLVAVLTILAPCVRCWPTPQSQLPLQLSIRHGTEDSSGDIPEQREALLSLYKATNGSNWTVLTSDGAASTSNASWGWESRNTSYCSWPGILCCSTAQQLQHLLADLQPDGGAGTVSCENDADVLGLFLSEAGLQGMLPDEILQLSGLRMLMLGCNPGLTGSWPASLQLPQLQILDVQYTPLSICLDSNTSSSASTSSSCQLPSWLSYGPMPAGQTPDADGLLCPQLTLNSSMGNQQSGSSVLMAFLGLLHINGNQQLNTVRYSAGFTGAAGCTCAAAEHVVRAPKSSSTATSNSTSSWRCEAVSSTTLDATRLAFIAAFAAVSAVLIIGGCWFLYRGGACHRAWACLTGRLDMYMAEQHAAAAATIGGEMTMVAKRSRFPGTPSIALAKGRGVLAVSEVLVTWVVTDVEGSTQLWEWDPVVMGAAVDQHNVVLRSLLDEHGGHEVRTDGDSFTLAFHDAADAVAYCIQAQEELLEVPWPKKLLEHPYCATVRLGEVCATKHPEAAAQVVHKGGIPLDKQGPLVMNGLRVRMGINTGVPDDIFVHDLTEHVEYRGEEYDLTDDIAGIAAGGQILMGPKTFQRWNRVFSQAAMPADNDLNVHISDASQAFGLQREPAQPILQAPKSLAGGLAMPQTWHSPPQKSSTFRRSLESVAEFFVGTPAKSFISRTANLTPTIEPSDNSEHLVSGGDTLLVFNSQGGTQTVAIGRNTDEAQAVVAASAADSLYSGQSWTDGANGIDRLAVEAAVAAALAAGPQQSDIGGVRAAAGGRVNKLQINQFPPNPAAQPVATDGKIAVRKKPPLPRSKTIGGISFAINTAGSATLSAHSAAAGGLHVVAAAAAAANPLRRPSGLLGLEQAALQSDNRSGLPPVAGTVSIKGPGYGPQLTRHVSFKTSGVGGSRRATMERLGSIHDRIETVSESPRPVGEAVEQDGTVSYPSFAHMHQPNSSTTPDNDAYHAWKLAQPEGAGHQLHANQHHHAVFAENPAGQGSSAQTASGAKATTVGSMLRRMSMFASNLFEGRNMDEHEGASYLVSTNGSSHSTQRSRQGSKSTRSRSRSSVWGSIAWKGDKDLGAEMDRDSKSFETSNAVLLDLGYYQWRPDEPVQHPGLSDGGDNSAEVQAAAAAAAAQAVQDGLLHLVQVQSHRLAPRMLLFDWPLKAVEGDDAMLQQLLPGFLDAPGASSLMFSSMRSLMEQAGAPPPAKPEVAIAFVAPAGLKEVQALGPEVYQACQSLFTSVVREVLLAVGGYESKEVGGQVLAAFGGPAQAVEWALALQCALLQAPWPEELAQLPCTATIDAFKQGVADRAATSGDTQNSDSNFYSPDSLFRGIRARVGIWSGPMDRVLPHGKSGRADYLGPPANRAARMMGAAQGGQVLVEQGIMQQVLEVWHQVQEKKANAAVAAAAAAASAASNTPESAAAVSAATPSDILEWDLQPGSPGSACTPKLSEGPASPSTTPKLLRSGTNMLASRRSRRRTRQEAAEESAGPAAGQHLNASLLASFRRNAPRPLLFDNVLDSAALLGPATAAFSPAKTVRRRKSPAPWDAVPDDSTPTASVAPGTAQRTSPLQDMHLPSASGSTETTGSGSANLPSTMQLELPASFGAPKVLTIAPAAYQPRGGATGYPERQTRSNRSTRSTTSTTGSIVAPTTMMMKGRKSLNIAVAARPSLDLPGLGAVAGQTPAVGFGLRSRPPAAAWPSADNPEAVVASAGAAEGSKDHSGQRMSESTQSVGVRRRSINFGNQVVDTEDLYSAVEAALGAPIGPVPAAGRGKRRATLPEHKTLNRLQQEQVLGQQAQPAVSAAAEGQPAQGAVASAFSSAFYSAAVLKPSQPSSAISSAAAGVSNSSRADDISLSQLLPISAFARPQGDAALGTISEQSADSNLKQADSTRTVDTSLCSAASGHLPVSGTVDSDYQRRHTKDLLGAEKERVCSLAAVNSSCSSCNSTDLMSAASSCPRSPAPPPGDMPTGSNVSLKSIISSVRQRPQLNLVVDDPANVGPRRAEAAELHLMERTAGTNRVQAGVQKRPLVPSDPGGKLSRSVLQNVSFPVEMHYAEHSLSLKGLQDLGMQAKAADAWSDKPVVAQQQVDVQRPQQSTSGSGGKSSGSGSKSNSSSGSRRKQQDEKSIWQVADALYNAMRRTGSNHGAAANSASKDGATTSANSSHPNSRKPTKSDGGGRPAGGIAGVWDAFTNTMKSAAGSRAASGSGGAAAPNAPSPSKSPGLEKHPSADADGAHGRKQHASTPRDAAKPGIIAECFRITPAAAPGETGESVESITMIKYTALRQQAAKEAAQESLSFAPCLAAAAAAAGAFSSGNSTAGTSVSLGSSVKLHRWPQLCVDVCVYRVGGFRLKGVLEVVDVVQVMPTTLVGRLQMLPPPSTKGKSQCVAPASGLVTESKVFLPDLSQLIDWMIAPLLEQQQAWLEEQEQQQLLQQEQEQWLKAELTQMALQHEPLQDMQQYYQGFGGQVRVEAALHQGDKGIGGKEEREAYEDANAAFSGDSGVALGHLGLLHSAEHDDGTGSDPSFSIRAYHGPGAGPFSSSQDAECGLSVIMSVGSGASAGLPVEAGPHSASGGTGEPCTISRSGSPPQLPNYIASHPGSVGATNVVLMGDSAAANVGHQVGGAFSQLKGPALLQTSVLQEH